MKTIRNITILLITIFISSNAYSFVVSSNAYSFVVNGIYYRTTSSSTVEVTNNYSGSGWSGGHYTSSLVEIPSQVTDQFGKVYKVTSIGFRAFYNCDKVASVTIPSSVTSIGDNAFEACTGLINIVLPNSVTSIGDNAFKGCRGLMNIVIPNTTSIGRSAFRGCSNLKTISLPEYITSIGDSCFMDCTKLTQVNLPDKIKKLNAYLFYGCSSLSYINLPDDLQTISSNAFFNTSLNKIELPESVLSIDDKAFGSSLKTIICKPTNPPVFLLASSFSNYSATVYVNCSDISAYKNGIWGMKFSDIRAIGSDTTIYKTVCYGTNLLNGKLTATKCGTFYDTLTAYNGCDSIIKLDLTVMPLYNDTIKATICNGSSYTDNGFNTNSSGVHIQHLESVNGCDSVVVLDLTVTPKYDTVIYDTICNGEFYNKNGFYYKSMTGLYTDSLKTIFGCDSVVTLNLTVNPSYDTTIFANICEGETYSENGFNANYTGEFIQNLSTINGCDSIVRLQLMVNPIKYTSFTPYSCHGETYNQHGFYADSTGIYRDTLVSHSGCDSIITLNLYVYPQTDTVFINSAICDGEVYDANGFYATESGQYSKTFTDYNGCDYTKVLNLTVNPKYNTVINEEIMQGQNFYFGEEYLNTAGIYYQTLTSINGCDSVISLNLTVNIPDTVYLHDTITLTDTITDTVFIHDTIIPCATVRTYIYATINDGDTYNNFGFNESTAGEYTLNLQTTDGCDSIVTLILQVTAGIDEIQAERIISIYPNPAKDKITIKADGDVTIFNNKGQTIKVIKNMKGVNEINVSDFETGVYYIKVGKFTKKLIVE